MDNHTDVLACVASAGLLIINEHRKRQYRDVKLLNKNARKTRRWWVRPILTDENRYMHGAETLINEMRLNDIDSFFNYTRMSPNSFDKLLHLVGPHIKKQQSLFRSPIPPSTKLALTLRYLATGDSQASISYAFRLGKATTCVAIRDTLDALWLVLKEETLPAPTEATWLEIAEGFSKSWNFPNCVGAIDGKHIRIVAPPLDKNYV